MQRAMIRRSGINDLVASFLKYLVAGGIAFVVDFSALMVCHSVLGVHYLAASVIGFVLGLIVTYICSNTFVFSQRKMEDKQVAEFTIFTIIGLVGLGLTTLFMWLFVSVCGGMWELLGLTTLLQYMYSLVSGVAMTQAACVVALSKLMTEALVLLWNFGARKIILY